MFRGLVHLALLLTLLAGCTRQRAAGGEAPVESRPVAELRAQGRQLFMGRGGCITCHKVGAVGDKSRGPNLGVGDDMTDVVAARAALRRPGWRAIEYMIESLVDPDAVTVKGYAKGVMKAPEEPPIALTDAELVAIAAWLAGEGAREPLDDAALSAGRAQIAKARAQRATRVVDDRASQQLAAVRWDEADAVRGQRIADRLGCQSCHGDVTRKDLGAPDFSVVRGRLRREEIARWMIAPPTKKMPSYANVVTSQELADVCAWVIAPPPTP